MSKLDKWQAIQAFWSQFGIPAYDENTVPDDAVMPYITYEARTANLGQALFMTGQIFYYTKSWQEISQKADEIAAYIGYGNKILPLKDGYMYISQGSPFAQRMAEDSNGDVRRIVINIAVEFFTAD